MGGDFCFADGWLFDDPDVIYIYTVALPEIDYYVGFSNNADVSAVMSGQYHLPFGLRPLHENYVHDMVAYTRCVFCFLERLSHTSLPIFYRELLAFFYFFFGCEEPPLCKVQTAGWCEVPNYVQVCCYLFLDRGKALNVYLNNRLIGCFWFSINLKG